MGNVSVCICLVDHITVCGSDLHVFLFPRQQNSRMPFDPICRMAGVCRISKQKCIPLEFLKNLRNNEDRSNALYFLFLSLFVLNS